MPRGDIITGFEHGMGGAGNDQLTAAAAGSTLLGGGGNDSLIGGAGADTLDGQGGGADRVDYASASTGVTVNLADNVAETGGAAGDVLTNIEVIFGSDVAGDSLFGGRVAETLIGGGGDDSLTGGAGADSLEGGAGADVVDYSGSSIGVTGESEGWYGGRRGCGG